MGGKGPARSRSAAGHRMVSQPACGAPGPGAAPPILVVGSVALDSIETPFATRDDVLGGAAVHFSAAAGLLAEVRLVGVVGRDFPLQELEFLRARGVDLSGVEVAEGPSFRWRGRYHLDMDHR